MCTVKLRYKNKIARCTFFIVPGNGPAMLGMSDIELLGILKMMFDVVERTQRDRRFTPELWNHPLI